MNELVLTKSSSESDLKRYFTAVLELSKSDNKFPINLDEVWMLVYERRDKAFNALRRHFYEGEDFYLTQMGKVVTFKELKNGIKVECHLSVSCLEYFIARKVRPVFEVYRQVFHKTANPTVALPTNYKDALKRLLAEVEEKERLQTENTAQASTIQEQHETIRLQKEELQKSAPKVNYYDEVLQSTNTMTTTQVAKSIGMEANVLNRRLRDAGIIFRQSGMWMLRTPYSRWNLHSVRVQTFTHSDGRIGTSQYTVWNERGRRFIVALHENGFKVHKAIKTIREGKNF